MFLQDHNPLHFKAKYGDYEANISIASGEIIDGDMSKVKLKLIVAWAEIHKEELEEMWNSKLFHKIKPLN